MKIKSSTSKSVISRIFPDKFRRRRTLFKIVLIAFALLGVIVLSFGILLFGAQQKRISKLSYSKSTLLKVAESDLSPMQVLLKPQRDAFMEINLVVESEYLREIESLAGKRVSDRNNEKYLFNEFPAVLTFENNDYPVGITVERGKGSYASQELRNLFRIQVKDEERIEDMIQFTLQDPGSVKFLNDWLGYQLAVERGISCLKNDFVKLKINGKESGIYFLQEEFNDLLVNSERFKGGTFYQSESDIRFPLTSDMESSASSRLEPANLIHVFDERRWAKFFAIADVLVQPQLLLPDHVGFYLNPETGKVEPLVRSFDFTGIEASAFHLSTLLESSVVHGKWNSILAFHPHVSQLIRDISFKKLYLAEAKEISQLKFVDDFFLRYGDQTSTFLKRVFPGSTSPEAFITRWHGRSRLTHDILFPDRHEIYSWYEGKNDNKLKFTVSTEWEIPIEISHVSWRDSIYFFPDSNIVLEYGGDDVAVSSVNLSVPSDFTWNDSLIPELRLGYHLAGLVNDKRSVWVFPYSFSIDRSKAGNPVMREANHMSLPFIIEENTNGTIIVPQGQWTLTQDLVIPPKREFLIEAGSTIDLIDHAKIICYSPVKAVGRADKPIVFKSSDMTGQGLTVIGANQRSLLSHALFEGLSRPEEEGWQLTGAVTFYESPVDLASCTFSKNQLGDDYVNIIRSDFTMDSVVFIDVLADAFDCDFCTGSLTKSAFVNIGNDGIDISGSDITVNEVFMQQIGDKGLSAGENSKLVAEWITIQDAEIAVTSKDRSEFILRDATLKNSRIGIALFQKKSEFGPAYLAAERIDISRSEIPYLVEPRSHLVVDGERLMPNKENVKDILYGIEYGRSSD